MTIYSASLPGTKAFGDWLTRKVFGDDTPPDPLMDRLTRLENDQTALRKQLESEQQARALMEERHALEVVGLKGQIEIERQERKIVAEALKLSEEREREKEKDIKLLQSTIGALQENAAQLTRMLTDQGSEQAALREQLTSQSERITSQRTIIDAQNGQIAETKLLAAQAKDEAQFWRSVGNFVVREFDALRVAQNLAPYGSIDSFADVVRTAYRSTGSAE